jgi:hypothetical protein
MGELTVEVVAHIRVLVGAVRRVDICMSMGQKMKVNPIVVLEKFYAIVGLLPNVILCEKLRNFAGLVPVTSTQT